jgi:hypothetical protein
MTTTLKQYISRSSFTALRPTTPLSIPKNPLARAVLTVMVESGDYYFFALGPVHAPRRFPLSPCGSCLRTSCNFSRSRRSVLIKSGSGWAVHSRYVGRRVPVAIQGETGDAAVVRVLAILRHLHNRAFLRHLRLGAGGAGENIVNNCLTFSPPLPNTHRSS